MKLTQSLIFLVPILGFMRADPKIKYYSSDAILQKRMLPDSYDHLAVPLPIVDVSPTNYAQKWTSAAERADADKCDKYATFGRTLQYRGPAYFDYVRDHYQDKRKKLNDMLEFVDYRLQKVEEKKRIFETLASRLEQLPHSYLADLARYRAKNRGDLKCFRHDFYGTENVQRKIHDYLNGKFLGGPEIEETWQEDYLLILRDEAEGFIRRLMRIEHSSMSVFDLLSKHKRYKEFQNDFRNGRQRRGKDITRERLDHKKYKLDLLVDALLYGNPHSARLLSMMASEKQSELKIEKEKLLASLAKVNSKRLEWEAEEQGRRNRGRGRV